MNIKKLGTIIGGVMLIAVAVWIMVTGNGISFRYIGSVIFAFLGSGTLVPAFKGSTKET